MMLARGALCRLAADVPRTSTHDLPQLARFLQRALLARNASKVPAIRALSRAYASALDSRRSYATTTRATKPTATVKKAVKTQAAKKPATKKRASPAKKTKKTTKTTKTQKKAVAKKAAPKKRVKKAPTPEQKEKAAITELRKKALKEPVSKRPLSGAIVYIGELTSRKGGSVEAGRQRLADAAKQWKTLTPAEVEHYNHLAIERNATRQAEYKAWITSHTPEQIRVANRARLLLRKKLVGTAKGKKGPAHTAKLHDDRHVKQAGNAYVKFFTERHASGDLKGISATDAAKLIGNEWKALSAGEKKKYEDLSNSEKAQRSREQSAASS
ncbi:hypothetical protein N0V83_007082 [Neocucurbitaria cava]|uniref:HMG box domain-containing protein n=1 Tax=Neocucurbitaria cava TaxID=798079 RepID=A0A9W9CKQ3_9PLEO|nr:hypothetical protein N0V83_007082 [Neocucurbitaria cava]